MLPLEYTGRWQAASILLLLCVTTLMLMPAVWLWPDVDEISTWMGSYDKWAHVAIFSVLSLWFAGQYRVRAYWRIALGLFAFGMLVEVCQGAMGYRMAEWLDVAGNAAGIAVGLLVSAAGIGGWSLRFEQWLAARRA
jgi:hypothetical protein